MLSERRWPDLIIVGIEPAVKLACDRYPGGRIGVMATPMTLREGKFSHLVHRFQDQDRIDRLPAPGLVELVEAGRGNSPEAAALLEPILGPFRGKLDAVVLGCTHYPFAEKAIARVLGPDVPLLDGGEGTARETLRRLRQADLLEEGTGQIVIENSTGDQALTDLSFRLLESL